MKTTYRRRIAALLAAAALLSSCSQGAEASELSSDALTGRLSITGSSTCAPVVAEMAKRFEELHPGVRIEVQTGGSSRGIADARRGTADIGLVSRELTEDELVDLVPHTFARDGVCVIVNASNPVRSLADGEVADIYLGRIRRWSEVGGADAEITVVNKAAGRSTLEVFAAHFGLAPEDIQADVVIGDNEHGIKTVAGDPQAVAYVSIGAAQFSARSGVPIALLPAGGVPAATAEVAAGRFPIARPLNLVTRGAPQGLAAAFVVWCLSPAVHDLVRDLYFVPIAPE